MKHYRYIIREVLSDVVLKAPAGATAVTPTTTIMKESNLSADEVIAVLDLPDGIDPTSFNPYGSVSMQTRPCC